MKNKYTVYSRGKLRKMGKQKKAGGKIARVRKIVAHNQRKKFKRNRIPRKKTKATVDYSLIYRRNQQELSVIITRLHHEELNKDLLHQIQGLQPKEVIVVQLGQIDRNLNEESEQDIRFFTYPHAQNYFVGRGIGANYASGEVFLFLDNHMTISTNDLLPFVVACYGNSDIVLANNNPFYVRKEKFDPINVAKSFLNHTLQLRHLMFSSLMDTPHAIKKRTADIIGFENLIVPPKAMAIAAVNGLTINQINGKKRSFYHKVIPLVFGNRMNAKHAILGDHIEAFNYLQSTVGARVYFPDKNRKRDLLVHLKNKE